MAGPDMYFDDPEDKQMALAIARGDMKTIQELVHTGSVDVLKIGRDATNWLIIAILSKKKASLDKLIELGALKDPEGSIAGEALYTATLVNDLYWLKRLHAAGADLNNYGGGDLLLVAAMNTRNAETLDFYLMHGADINRPTTIHGSVASSAARARRFDLVNDFLDRGADPWVIDAFGMTLGFAAEKAGKVPAWDHRSAMNQQRLELLERLHAIGFPNPAPTPDHARELKDAGRWPPLNVPKVVPRRPER